MDRPSTAPNAKPNNLVETSSSNYAGRMSLAAAEGAQALVNRCRLRRDIPDPREFWLALAYVLDQYDPTIIRHVTDPFTGLPGRLKYPLEIADVRRACELATLPGLLNRYDEARRTAAEQRADEEARKAEEIREREAERARAAPKWPPIAARLEKKLRLVTFRSAFANAKLGTFVDGNLQIIVPPGELETANASRASITHWVHELFPRVVTVRFVEVSREAEVVAV